MEKNEIELFESIKTQEQYLISSIPDWVESAQEKFYA